ncbi:MAG TPA: acetyl-CoA acetyltransferase, partial [Novosphingobium sp.]|nr:acetyl-CoA acetyltransferase [Novosphingobium sp.]
MTAPSPAHVPVIVGVGEISDRLADGHEGLEPRDLIAAAARRADADAGGGWLSSIDTVAVVNILSWPYADICASLAAALGIAPARAEELPAGGNVALKAIHDIANRIAGGAEETALVCGAEAFRSVALARKAGRTPGWTAPDSGHWIKTMVDVVGPDMLRYGFDGAPSVYALYENAMRAARGLSHAEAQAQTGAMWAAMSQVAAGVEEAWIRTPRAAAEIITPGPDNRPIAFPYTKLMVANDAVNQGSAVIVTSLARARAAGVEEGRIAYVWGGAAARDRRDFRTRDRYDHSPSIEAVIAATLAQSGLAASAFDAVEFYSCFPCVPRLAQGASGIDPAIVPTVAGGLTYFGGPGNDYMTHAVINMVRQLRAGKRLGLLLGNGDLVTKHHAMI